MTEQVSGVPSQRDRSADRSTGQLVEDLSNEVSRLVRDEIRLATDELQRKAKRAGAGLVAAVLAGTTTLLGSAAFVAAAILAIALALPGWAAALIVGGALFVLAALLAGAGFLLARKGTPPIPEEAMRGVRADAEAVREGARR